MKGTGRRDSFLFLNWTCILVPRATRFFLNVVTSFANHVTKRNGGSGDENGQHVVLFHILSIDTMSDTMRLMYVCIPKLSNIAFLRASLRHAVRRLVSKMLMVNISRKEVFVYNACACVK